MDKCADRKIVLITRKTRLEELTARYGTASQAKFYVEHLGADFGEYLDEHENYLSCRKRVTEALGNISRLQVVERSFLPNFIFATDDVVVVLGQDGLVANVMKYLDGQPLVGVNPDPARWDGVLLPFAPRDAGLAAAGVLSGKMRTREVTMARARLKDGQTIYAVNDLFIGPRSHTSALYTLRSGEREERQSSSGIIVSTGLGSTGWMRSLIVGAEGIVRGEGGGAVKSRYRPIPCDAGFLTFTVREPFPSRHSEAGVIIGRIDERRPFSVMSHMAENGVIFSDGIEADYLAFSSGMEVNVGVADRKGLLVV